MKSCFYFYWGEKGKSNRSILSLQCVEHELQMKLHNIYSFRFWKSWPCCWEQYLYAGLITKLQYILLHFIVFFCFLGYTLSVALTFSSSYLVKNIRSMKISAVSKSANLDKSSKIIIYWSFIKINNFQIYKLIFKIFVHNLWVQVSFKID